MEDILVNKTETLTKPKIFNQSGMVFDTKKYKLTPMAAIITGSTQMQGVNILKQDFASSLET